MNRKPYSSDVSDEEWLFIVPYLTLMTEAAPQRDYELREVFNGLRWLVRTGSQWRLMPHDLPPWWTVYQQNQRWCRAEVFDAVANDLRRLLRLVAGRTAEPSAVIFDSRTLQSTPESGSDAGYDGAKKRRGHKAHMAVDTMGQLLVIYITAANEQDRAQVAELAEQVQGVTGGQVEIAFVDQGYTGQQVIDDAASQGLKVEVIKLSEVKKGFVLLPVRWVIERSFGWLARFRRLARDFERLSETLANLHFLAFAMLLLHRFADVLKFSV
jgi:transposase